MIWVFQHGAYHAYEAACSRGFSCWFRMIYFNKKTTLTTYLVNSSTLKRFTFNQIPQVCLRMMPSSRFQIVNDFESISLNHKDIMIVKSPAPGDLQISSRSSVFLGSGNTPPYPSILKARHLQH